jgi:alpha-L-fucosidase 2
VEFKGQAAPPRAPLCLWYTHPAAQWTEALPIGNGHIGAMVFGGLPTERVQFTEHTIWTGKPHSYAHEGAAQYLPELRRLLQESREKEREALKLDPELKSAAAREVLKIASARQIAAQDLATKHFMSQPMRQMAYQPGGDLWIDQPGVDVVTDYKRWLDLDTAACVSEYRVGETLFRREAFVSYPDKALVVRFAADKPGSVTCLIRLSSPHTNSSITVQGQNLVLKGQVQEDGIRFESVAQVKSEGGSLAADDRGIRVTGADALEIRLVVATNFRNFRDLSEDPAAKCRGVLGAVAGKSYDQLRQAHVVDHQSLFRRVTLDLGRTSAADQPTNERIARFSEGNDPHLAVLAFQYGRYLLIGSSRAGGQPANLQGIWNDSLQPPWDSKYTANINVQMNYWPALPGNLPECEEPLFDAIRDLVVSGQETARAHYGAPGWVLHHNFDLWRGTAPINASNHGIWVTGGAWLCEQMWEHYQFTGDKEFLAERAYPAMKGACEFFLSFLYPDPITGRLISGPSNSPEQGGLVMGPTMDHQIIRSLFGNTARAARELGTDAEFAARLDETRPRIAPNMIGRLGQLQEWLEDKDDPENKHRHVSHLWGVYPGADITWQDAQFFRAARQSLIFRGDPATGWSMGWKVNLWARFLDGDHAFKILSSLLQPIGKVKDQGGMYPNLFDAHPPFQIDGNFGAAAGVAEMLVQSHCRTAQGLREIQLLPALPKVWQNGSVSGLRARSGVVVGMRWKDGKVQEARLQFTEDGPIMVKFGEKRATLTGKKGQSARLDAGLLEAE